MGRWEWIILEVGFLGLLIYELISVRRAIRKARDAKPLPGRPVATERKAVEEKG